MSSRRAPLFVYMRLQRDCHLSCRIGPGCPCPKVLPGSGGPSLTEAAWREVIRGLAGDGARLLYITDGNPLDHPSLWPLALLASAEGLRVRVTVPAELVDDDVCRKALGAGVDAIQVRVGGLAPDLHDRLRWPGAAAATRRGIELLVKAGLAVHVIMPVLAGNASAITDVYGEIESLGAVELALTRPLPNSFMPDCPAGLVPTPQTYLEAVLTALKNSKPRPFLKTADPVFGRWNRPLRERLEREIARRPDLMNACLGGCLAGRDIIFIDYDGTVYPCRYLPVPSGSVACGYDVDRLLGGVLAKNWRPQLDGECGVCRLKPVCGGCRAYAWAMSNSQLGPDLWCGLMEPVTADLRRDTGDEIRGAVSTLQPL